MANRLVAPAADGATTLRKGRLYRLLAVVNGQPGGEELRQAALSWGLADVDTVVSWPGTWGDDKPGDWPAEAAVPVAANEFLVRISGSQTGQTRTVGKDFPIEGGGTITIAQAWDYAPALSTTKPSATTSSSSEIPAEDEGPTPDEKRTHDRQTFALIVLAGLGAFALWRLHEGDSKVDKETERMAQIWDRARRAKRAERIRQLMTGGHSEDDAAAIAETESWEHAAALHHEHAEAV